MATLFPANNELIVDLTQSVVIFRIKINLSHYATRE